MALLQVNFFSQILGMAMTMDVILPEGSQGIGVNARPVWDGEEELPVLYLLHGTSDDHTIWQRRTSIERYVADKKLAVVMPNAHISAYTNQRFGFRFFDFVAEEVPAFCQKYFKISAQREKNFIAGLSMGGYGALKIGMRCADRFGYAAGLSSGCERMAMLPPQAAGAGSLAELELLKPEMTPEAYQAAIQFFVNFGSPQEYRQSKSDNLFLLAEDRVKRRLPMPEIWMTCGSEDAAVKTNRDFHELLTRLGVAHTYTEAPGIHNWAFWDTQIQRVLDWLPL